MCNFGKNKYLKDIVMVSRSARYYRASKESREKKAEYDTAYHATDKRKKYRTALNRVRRRKNLKGDERDLSHTKSGGLVLEDRSKNRARQGSNNLSTKK
jgi:hypothetical protein